MADNREMIPRVFLWCTPRTVSTALTKCMSFVDGVEVWFEPYTTCAINTATNHQQLIAQYSTIRKVSQNFKKAKEDAEGELKRGTGGNLKKDEVFTYPWVQQQLQTSNPEGKKFLFIKDMAFAVDGQFEFLPRGVPCRHTFLVRHPYRVSTALRRHSMIVYGKEDMGDKFDMTEDNPFMLKENDFFLDLWKFVRSEGLDPDPIVINMDDLLKNPEDILSKYFSKLGIPWDSKYLNWPPSDQIVDSWHVGIGYQQMGRNLGYFTPAFQSECFWPLTSKIPDYEELTPDCKKLLPRISRGYEELNATRIKPGD